MTNDHSPEPGSKSENTWAYQAPPPEKKGFDFLRSFAGLLATLFYLALFSFLPVVVFIATDWVVYLATKNTFYSAGWVQPTVLMMATFLSGAYARIVMEESFDTMGVFLVGILGLIVFAGITWFMLDNPGTLYATWLPTSPGIDTAIVFGLPCVGVVGMFCYKFFSLRH